MERAGIAATGESATIAAMKRTSVAPRGPAAARSRTASPPLQSRASSVDTAAEVVAQEPVVGGSVWSTPHLIVTLIDVGGLV